MSEVIVKQGFLYFQQQQTFGKKWRRFWAVLYGESSCSLARLELQEGPEKPRRGEAARRVIRLSDCLRAAEAGGETGSPKDTSPFLLETTERLCLLAAPTLERSEWLQAICHLAFPRIERREPVGQEDSTAKHHELPCMEENVLYSSAPSVTPKKDFVVTVRPTEASERCRLQGSYKLRAGESALELRSGPEPGTVLYTWPYRFLRRFGRDKVTFSFEAGRRCVSGEGNFEFETRKGNEIFLALEDAISAQKNSASFGTSSQPTVVTSSLPLLESPYSHPHDSLPPPTPTMPPFSCYPRAPEGEYAVPFDSVARSLLGNSPREALPTPPHPSADPLYDCIEERLSHHPDHIYDEPEGVAALSLYDSPQEPQGEAWRTQATADDGPTRPYQGGLGDFLGAALHGWSEGAEYDNVVLKRSPK
ncbi:docking protein 2 isoform X1 [Phascolarctos cinereus]|uniref:Docking protein 2 isoform X1 n=1 Tax=Phascolarctos cinereus TaxID=38626 RepID=A0A6P5JJV8_PHACI|nr:docking protein 2 isoform X1 [Phascolarctos cinereus]